MFVSWNMIMASFSFVNLTPHAITVLAVNGGESTFQPSGKVARVSELATTVIGQVNGVPVLSKTVFGDVIDLPEPHYGVFFLVSGMVAGQVLNRKDVLAPATGPNDGAIRNDKGHIVAVTQFKSASTSLPGL